MRYGRIRDRVHLAALRVPTPGMYNCFPLPRMRSFLRSTVSKVFWPLIADYLQDHPPPAEDPVEGGVTLCLKVRRPKARKDGSASSPASASDEQDRESGKTGEETREQRLPEASSERSLKRSEDPDGGDAMEDNHVGASEGVDVSGSPQRGVEAGRERAKDISDGRSEDRSAGQAQARGSDDIMEDVRGVPPMETGLSEHSEDRSGNRSMEIDDVGAAKDGGSASAQREDGVWRKEDGTKQEANRGVSVAEAGSQSENVGADRVEDIAGVRGDAGKAIREGGEGDRGGNRRRDTTGSSSGEDSIQSDSPSTVRYPFVGCPRRERKRFEVAPRRLAAIFGWGGQASKRPESISG